MSAFIVEKRHIDLMVNFGRIYGDFRLDELDRIGQILVDENYKSVNCRYDESTKPDKYFYEKFGEKITPTRAVMACRCLNYQSCESDDYDGSEAERYIKKIEYTAVDLLLEAAEPGYNYWGEV